MVIAMKKNLIPKPDENFSQLTTSLTETAIRVTKQPSKIPKEIIYMTNPVKLVISGTRKSAMPMKRKDIW